MSFFSAPAGRRLICLGLLASLLLSFIITVVRDKDLTSSLSQGDFPAFYSAGRLAVEGKWDFLYSFADQQRIQNENWPGLNGDFLGFVYPPFVALIFMPFASVPGLTAKYLYLLCCLLTLGLVSALLRKSFRTITLSRLELVTLCLCFPPALMGIVGGQNSIFSLLLVVLFSAAALSSQTRLAGFYLGLLFFKPNLGLIFLCLGLAILGKSLLIGTAISLGIYYLSSALVLGVFWPLSWLRATTAFSGLEYEANQHQLLALTDLLFLAWRNSNFAGLVISTLTLVFCLYLLAARLWILRKGGAETEILRQQTIISLPLAVTVLSPHVMFYESLLWLLPVVATDLIKPLLKVRGKAFLIQMILLTVFFGLLMSFKSEVPLSPLAVLNLGFFLRAFRRAQPLAPG